MKRVVLASAVLLLALAAWMHHGPGVGPGPAAPGAGPALAESPRPAAELVPGQEPEVRQVAAPATEPAEGTHVPQGGEVELEDWSEEWVDAAYLPDPCERGECDLELLLVDAFTGDAVASALELWRLDAPETEHWTRGDQLQTRVDVPPHGLLVRGLPAGGYRAVVHAQRNDSEDPPPFLVEGPHTLARLAVEMPGRFRVRIRLHDEEGNVLARVDRHTPSSVYHEVEQRGWLQRRQPKPENVFFESSVSMGASGGTWSSSADEEGYHDVGEFAEVGRGSPGAQVYPLTSTGRTDIECRIDQTFTGDVDLAGVMLPTQLFTDRILVPDGRTASAAGASFQFTGHPILLENENALEPWRGAPVDVRVALAGHRDLAFTYRLADGEVLWKTMALEDSGAD